MSRRVFNHPFFKLQQMRSTLYSADMCFFIKVEIGHKCLIPLPPIAPSERRNFGED